MSFYSAAERKWRKERGFRDPYMAILSAAEKGTGVNLTAEDCRQMERDCAVSTVAQNHYDEMMGDEED